MSRDNNVHKYTTIILNDGVIMKNCNADQNLTGEKKNFKHDEKKGRLKKKSTSSFW